MVAGLDLRSAAMATGDPGKQVVGDPGAVSREGVVNQVVGDPVRASRLAVSAGEDLRGARDGAGADRGAGRGGRLGGVPGEAPRGGAGAPAIGTPCSGPGRTGWSSTTPPAWSLSRRSGLILSGPRYAGMRAFRPEEPWAARRRRTPVRSRVSCSYVPGTEAAWRFR